MIFILKIYKIVAILIWSIIVGVWSIPYQFRSKWKDIRKISDIAHHWSAGIANILGMQIRVTGDTPVNKKGVVVSNHLSYLDVIAYGAILPFRYAPKVEIARWPVLGWYLGLSRPVWTDRKSRQASKKTLREFVKTIYHKVLLIVFPEGTSTDGKAGVLPFRSTSFEAAITAGSFVYPALISYRQNPRSPTVCWYGDMTLLPHAWQVLGMNKIEARISFLQSVPAKAESRKDLAVRVHRIMDSEYRKRVLNEVKKKDRGMWRTLLKSDIA